RAGIAISGKGPVKFEQTVDIDADRARAGTADLGKASATALATWILRRDRRAVRDTALCSGRSTIAAIASIPPTTSGGTRKPASPHARDTDAPGSDSAYCFNDGISSDINHSGKVLRSRGLDPTVRFNCEISDKGGTRNRQDGSVFNIEIRIWNRRA